MLKGQFPVEKFASLRTPFYYYDLPLLRRTLDKIRECIDRIAKDGPDPMMMQKSLEYQQKTLTNYVGTNDYWMQAIMQNIQYNTDDALTPAAALKQLTPADIRKMARLLSKSGNTTLAILDGVKL